jgi:hypothetical protein
MRTALVLVMLVAVGGCAQDPPNPAFPVTSAQAREAIGEMRQNARRLERPLVIVGGFADLNVSPPLFAGFFKRIASEDSHIITISVGLSQSFEACRRQVIAAVDRACPTDDPAWTAEVDVVGASLGGLVARYAAAPSRDAGETRRLRIHTLYTISSPHAGATLADAIAITDYHRDMRGGSAFMKMLAEADATAGYELVPYVRLHDEIVGARYAAPPGRNPYWLPNPPLSLAHLGAMLDDRILGDIARRLRGERPFTQAVATALPGSAGDR